MALEIALAATPQCQTGTPVSGRIRSGFHVGQVASWMTIQSLTKAVNHDSCSDRASQSIKAEIDPWDQMVQWGSLNDLLGHQKQANRPTGKRTAASLGLGWIPSSEAHWAEGTRSTQSKWTALNTGLILQDLVQAKEGPTQTHPSRFGLDCQTSWEESKIDNEGQVLWLSHSFSAAWAATGATTSITRPISTTEKMIAAVEALST